MGKHIRLTDELMKLLRSDKSSAQIARETGHNRRSIQYQRTLLGMRFRERVNWPADPEWYRIRTVGDMRRELGQRTFAIIQHLKRKKYAYCKGRWAVSKLTGQRTGGQPVRGFTYRWPADREWYAQRTARQIAQQIGCNVRTVRSYCARRGMHCRPNHVIPSWPADTAWYEATSAGDMAQALHIQRSSVYRRLKRYGLPFRRIVGNQQHIWRRLRFGRGTQ
jgi:DNA-binding CsgD family transcriptional regulator